MAARPSLNRYFLNICDTVAERSTCARRKVGAVLVNQRKQLLSTGYNGVARGQDHCTDTPCPGAGLPSGQGLSLCEAIHAEQNALIQCQSPQDIFALYCTISPCLYCCKLMLGTPVQYIIFDKPYTSDGEAKRLAEKNGIIFIQYQPGLASPDWTNRSWRRD